jgi:hypothetical protein
VAPEEEEAEEEEALEGGSAEASRGVGPEEEEAALEGGSAEASRGVATGEEVAEEEAALEGGSAEASRGVAPEEEVAEEAAALEGGSAEASGSGMKTGGHRSRVSASGGPMKPTAASTTTEGQVHDRASSEVAVQPVAAAEGSEAGGGGTVVVEETAHARPSTEAVEDADDEAREGGAGGVAPEEEEEAEEEAALEGGSAEASGGGVKTGGHRSRVGAIGGPLEPAAASTTTEGQVHDGASTEVAVQTVAAAKGSEASGGGMAVFKEKAQGVKPDEEAAIEATITWGVEVEPRSAKKAEDEAREGGPVGVAPEEEGACEATDLQGEEVEAGVAKVSAGESPGPKAVLFSTSYLLNAGVDSVSSLEASGGVAAGAQKPGSSLHTTEARKKRKKKKKPPRP